MPAALAITGTWQGSNQSKLYEELGWESLSDRRCCRRILQIHKINNNMTPSYLRGKLPPRSRSNNRRHNNPNTFVEITCKTSTYFSLVQLSRGMAQLENSILSLGRIALLPHCHQLSHMQLPAVRGQSA